MHCIRLKKGICSQFYKVGKHLHFEAYSFFWNLFWKLFNRFCLLLQAAAIGSRKALKTTKQLLLHQTHIMSFRGKYLRQYFKRGYVRKLKTSWFTLHMIQVYWGRHMYQLEKLLQNAFYLNSYSKVSSSRRKH